MEHLSVAQSIIHKPKSFNSGMSIIEVIMGMGLLSVIIGLNAIAFKSQLEQQLLLTRKMSLVTLNQNITRSFALDYFCSCNFKGKQLAVGAGQETNLTGPLKLFYENTCDLPNSGKSDTIATAVGAPIYNDSSGLKLKKATFQSVSKISPKNYKGDLVLSIQADDGLQMKPLEFKGLIFQTSTDNKIIHCSTLGGSSTGLPKVNPCQMGNDTNALCLGGATFKFTNNFSGGFNLVSSMTETGQSGVYLVTVSNLLGKVSKFLMNTTQISLGEVTIKQFQGFKARLCYNHNMALTYPGWCKWGTFGGSTTTNCGGDIFLHISYPDGTSKVHAFGACQGIAPNAVGDSGTWPPCDGGTVSRVTSGVCIVEP